MSEVLVTRRKIRYSGNSVRKFHTESNNEHRSLANWSQSPKMLTMYIIILHRGKYWSKGVVASEETSFDADLETIPTPEPGLFTLLRNVIFNSKSLSFKSYHKWFVILLRLLPLLPSYSQKRSSFFFVLSYKIYEFRLFSTFINQTTGTLNKEIQSKIWKIRISASYKSIISS